MFIIADQILLYRKIHVLLLLFCDITFKFCNDHPEKNLRAVDGILKKFKFWRCVLLEKVVIY